MFGSVLLVRPRGNTFPATNSSRRESECRNPPRGRQGEKTAAFSSESLSENSGSGNLEAPTRGSNFRAMAGGRWCFRPFFLLAFLSNPFLFDIPVMETDNLPDLVLCVVLPAVQFSRRKIVWAGATALFTVISLVALALLTPAAYQ
jgi:hypothetical protein